MLSRVSVHHSSDSFHTGSSEDLGIRLVGSQASRGRPSGSRHPRPPAPPQPEPQEGFHIVAAENIISLQEEMTTKKGSKESSIFERVTNAVRLRGLIVSAQQMNQNLRLGLGNTKNDLAQSYETLNNTISALREAQSTLTRYVQIGPELAQYAAQAGNRQISQTVSHFQAGLNNVRQIMPAQNHEELLELLKQTASDLTKQLVEVNSALVAIRTREAAAALTPKQTEEQARAEHLYNMMGMEAMEALTLVLQPMTNARTIAELAIVLGKPPYDLETDNVFQALIASAYQRKTFTFQSTAMTPAEIRAHMPPKALSGLEAGERMLMEFTTLRNRRAAKKEDLTSQEGVAFRAARDALMLQLTNVLSVEMGHHKINTVAQLASFMKNQLAQSSPAPAPVAHSTTRQAAPEASTTPTRQPIPPSGSAGDSSIPITQPAPQPSSPELPGENQPPKVSVTPSPDAPSEIDDHEAGRPFWTRNKMIIAAIAGILALGGILVSICYKPARQAWIALFEK